MFLAVKFLINIRVANSKIRAEIDHARPGSNERLGEFRGNSVRQGQEHDFRRAGQVVRIGIRKLQRSRPVVMREPREYFSDRFPGKWT